jgi:hypothetical protein
MGEYLVWWMIARWARPKVPERVERYSMWGLPSAVTVQWCASSDKIVPLYVSLTFQLHSTTTRQDQNYYPRVLSVCIGDSEVDYPTMSFI